MIGEELYWYTVFALLFVMMAINSFANIKKRDYRIGSVDYLVYSILCILWPLLLTAIAGAGIGAMLRWAWGKVSK